MRASFVLTAALSLPALALLQDGCRTPPPREERVPSPPRQPRGPEDIPLNRRPAVVGDVLIYPCQWRNAEELGFRLYNILSPKYGPQIRIVPDRNQNALLIYLPPKEKQSQVAGSY